MSATVSQGIEARYTPGKSAEFVYIVRGAESEAAVRDAVLAEAPSVYEGLSRRYQQIEAIHFDSTNPDANIHSSTVFYGQVEPDDNTSAFDTTGGSQHITQSPYTAAKYPANAPNMQGAIGFDGERVNGTDIVIPTYEFTETHIKSKAQVDTAYRFTLAQLTGGVNNAAFRGFAAGEVLFRGVTGQLVNVEDDQQWQLNFRFAASPNRTVANGNPITVGTITNVEKLGWEYLWVLYGDTVNENRLVQHPTACYVERLYPFVDFSELGIGTT